MSWSSWDYFCHVRSLCKRFKRWSILSAIVITDYIAVDIFQRFYNSQRFMKFIKHKVLLKCHHNWFILVMNNISIHQSQMLRTLCEKVSVELTFLLSYLSDFNSIEQFFHALKTWIWRNQTMIYSEDQYKSNFENFLWLAVSFMKNIDACDYFRSFCIE